MENQVCVLANSPLRDWTLIQLRPTIRSTEVFVLGLDDAHELEWVVDDAIAQFGERRMESALGERFRIHESGATFLVLKGWAKLV